MIQKRHIGFTIVELLIVIVVIGILAAITIVAFSGVQERARIAAGLSFERQLKSKYGSNATGDWSFDQCSGTTVTNSDTNGITTDTITGTATWITDTPSGKGCALRFDGSSTRIESTATLGATYYIKAAWVRISTPSCASNNIISQAASSGAVAAFFVPSCRPSAGHNGSWYMVAAPQTINDNKWHYLALIWESNILTLYVDGKMASQATGIAAHAPADGRVSIGAHGGGNYMTGDIDNPFVAAN